MVTIHGASSSSTILLRVSWHNQRRPSIGGRAIAWYINFPEWPRCDVRIAIQRDYMVKASKLDEKLRPSWWVELFVSHISCDYNAWIYSMLWTEQLIFIILSLRILLSAVYIILYDFTEHTFLILKSSVSRIKTVIYWRVEESNPVELIYESRNNRAEFLINFKFMRELSAGRNSIRRTNTYIKCCKSSVSRLRRREFVIEHFR